MRLVFCLVLTWLLALPAAADSSRSLVYNARNQLTDVIDAANPARHVAFTYDVNGNRETKTQGGVTTTYRWDARNRLIEVLRGGTWVARYEYGSTGQRTRKDVNGPAPTAVRYTYDGPRLVAETNVIGNTLARYYYSDAGQLLAMERAGQRYSYLLDGLDTPIAMTSAEGLIVVRYRVDAWGNPVATVGDSANIFGFTGYPVDDETGLHYANARYYDSELGAFLSEDPAQGNPLQPVTLHPYLYGNGNPLIYLDRSGRTAELVDVLDGHERNQADIVELAEQIKGMRSSASWYERPFVELGLAGTVLLTAGNRLGEGVVTMANAGANVALTAAESGLGADPGPAIKMDPADHYETSSNGRRPVAGKMYRDDLKSMIDEGRMRDAMATEVRDVRRAAQLVSSNIRKYNQAMQQMLDYAKGKGWLDKGKKE